MTSALPDNTGYVAAAYLVFLGLILVYVVIMATRLSRTERDLAEIDELLDRRSQRPPGAGDHDGERVQERV
jgi:hypothetical protein